MGSLAQRAQLWRDATAGTVGWAAATKQSLYRDEPSDGAISAASALLQAFWDKLQNHDLEDIQKGRIE